MSGLAFATDLKADLNLNANGVQQNKDLGNVVGGNTITFTDNLYLQGSTAVTSATFDDDGAALPAWVSDVTGGTALIGSTTASTITVVAPCTLGTFGADGGSVKVAGSSVQYQVSAAVGALPSEIGVTSAWMNIRGNVTSLGSNCNTDITNPTGSISINDAAPWTNSSTGAVSLDLSAADNVGIVKYRLAGTAAGLATASDVTVSPAVTPFSENNVAFTLSGAEDANKAVWVRYYDAAGNSVEASDTIGWDKTLPLITDDSATNAPTGTQGSGTWWTSAVSVTFKASDNLSGFTGHINPYTFTKSTSGEGSAVTVSSDTVDDIAGNTSTPVTSSAFQIDLYDPTVTCNTPPTLVLGSTGQVSATVTDTADGSGPASTPVSESVSATSIGSHTVQVTGYDNAGRSTSVPCGYNVIYDWTGFFRPVDNLPTLNSVKAGSAVPVKFNLGGDQGLDVMATGYPKSQVMACESGALVDSIEETVTAGSSSLTYDSSAGQYVYVWKTDKAWAGTCRQLTVKLQDGTLHSANFKLLK